MIIKKQNILQGIPKKAKRSIMGNMVKSHFQGSKFTCILTSWGKNTGCPTIGVPKVTLYRNKFFWVVRLVLSNISYSDICILEISFKFPISVYFGVQNKSKIFFTDIVILQCKIASYILFSLNIQTLDSFFWLHSYILAK